MGWPFISTTWPFGNAFMTRWPMQIAPENIRLAAVIRQRYILILV